MRQLASGFQTLLAHVLSTVLTPVRVVVFAADGTLPNALIIEDSIPTHIADVSEYAPFAVRLLARRALQVDDALAAHKHFATVAQGARCAAVPSSTHFTRLSFTMDAGEGGHGLEGVGFLDPPMNVVLEIINARTINRESVCLGHA